MRPTTAILFLFFVPFLFANINCKSDEPLQPKTDNPPTVDTTSHNFTWTSYTFAGNYGSSYFKDVSIINDSDIWVVGLIYTEPYTQYNAAHWDGKKWILLQVPFYTICGQSHISSYPINAIFHFGEKDVWLSCSGEIIHWDGNSYEHFCEINSKINGGINKIWGTNSLNLYIVGDAGTILYFDGNVWTKQESGTTIDLRDVWGSADGKTVWACGESYDGNHSILLQNENGQWQTVWQRDGSTPVQPYGYDVGSVWSKNQSTYITSDYGVFQIKDSIPKLMNNNISTFSRNLRGNSEYDMLTTGEGGTIWHYNGVGWKQLLENPNYFIMGSNIKNNIAIAVGTDFSVGFGAGLIYFGKRK